MKETTGFRYAHLSRAVGRYCSILALSYLATPGMTLAQSVDSGAAGSAASADPAGVLEETIVTARRRDEDISRVPIAITAISARQILTRMIQTDSDLQSSVPGLTIRQTQGNNSLTYSIRGQSADTFSGSASAVIAYLDEVPLTISGASSFYDLESIQVLKGPQGTLFGRNTTGGAVLYTSAKPTDELQGMLRIRGGNYDYKQGTGMFNVPLVEDKLLLRGAFDLNKSDGYIDNHFNGDTLGDVDRKSGRLSLAIRPDDRLENVTVYQYSKADGTNTGASYTYSVYQCGDTNKGQPLTCDSGYLFGPTLDDVFGSNSWNAYLAEHPEAYAPGLLAYLDEQKRMGYYDTRHPGGAKHKGKDWNLSNTTRYEFTPNFQVKNILGASHAKTDSEQPQLGAPFVTILTANAAAGQSGNEQKVDSFSDELQLSGTAWDGDLDYIAGVYFQRMKSDTLWPQTYFDLSPVLAPSYVTNEFRIKNDTDAVYAQGTYHLGTLTGVDGLSVTAGLRYTWEDVSIDQLSKSTYTYGAPGQDESFSDPSWEFGLEYEISPSLFSYVKTRGSFRSGGFNGSAPPVDADATGGGNKFKSETTEDVEAGLKFNGVVFGRRATMEIDVYKQWIDDVQRVEFPDPDGPGGLSSIAVTANVPKMEVEGVEFQATIMPADWLELGLSGSYTDPKFTDGDVLLFGTQYSYGPVANTPKESGLVYAQLTFSSDESLGEMTLYSEVYAQSSMYFSNSADSLAPDTKLSSYELVNARFAWNRMFGSHMSAAVFGRNLADEEYFVGGMALAAALGHNAAAVGPPRTYGMELSYEF